jgi:hypothetical protein
MINIGSDAPLYPTLYRVNKVVVNKETGSVRLQLSTWYSDKREMVTMPDGTSKPKKHYSNWNAAYLVGNAKTKFLTEDLEAKKSTIIVKRGSITYESKFNETTQKYDNPLMPTLMIYEYEVKVWDGNGGFLANEPDMPEEIVAGNNNQDIPW